MKHKITPTEIPWFQAFHRMKETKKGERFTAQGHEFKLVHVYDDPHPPAVELSVKVKGNHWKTCWVKRGESLLTELQPRQTV